MIRKIAVVLCLLVFVFVTGCMTHVHTIGAGPKGSTVVEQRQWYVLWGLVPINNVNTKAMAAEATDYEIMTQQSALDFIINIFTGWVTVYSRTVTVTK